MKDGATLLIPGRFDRDPHFITTGWQKAIGLKYQHGTVALRENKVKWPEGEAQLQYDGNKADFLERACLSNGETFVENIGQIYQYALKTARVAPIYSSGLKDPGALICPTRFPHAALYVITSESPASLVTFRDEKMRKNLFRADG